MEKEQQSCPAKQLPTAEEEEAKVKTEVQDVEDYVSINELNSSTHKVATSSASTTHRKKATVLQGLTHREATSSATQVMSQPTKSKSRAAEKTIRSVRSKDNARVSVQSDAQSMNSSVKVGLNQESQIQVISSSKKQSQGNTSVKKRSSESQASQQRHRSAATSKFEVNTTTSAAGNRLAGLRHQSNCSVANQKKTRQPGSVSNSRTQQLSENEKTVEASKKSIGTASDTSRKRGGGGRLRKQITSRSNKTSRNSIRKDGPPQEEPSQDKNRSKSRNSSQSSSKKKGPPVEVTQTQDKADVDENAEAGATDLAILESTQNLDLVIAKDLGIVVEPLRISQQTNAGLLESRQHLDDENSQASQELIKRACTEKTEAIQQLFSCNVEQVRTTANLITSTETSLKLDVAASTNPPTSVQGGEETKAEEMSKPAAILPPPNPLLPKTVKVHDKAPESNIKGITFRKLKEFKSFQNQPKDKLATTIKTIKHDRSKSEAQSPTKERGESGSVQISIEQSRLIRNIIFLRDATILDNLGKGINELTQKDVFQHENFLDVKQLVRERDISERMTEQLTDVYSRAKQRHQISKFNSAAQSVVAPRGSLDTRTGNYKLLGPEDRTLMFESRFESGNLYMATKVSEQEYDLLMQNDTNTVGHTQWFYFKVQNTRAGMPVKFNILNYNKPDSMFNYGMKVTVYSERKADDQAIGWHRACTDISYFKNQVRKDYQYTKYYHTLTFTYEFGYDNDTVFFSYCYPYSYTDLQNDITKIERDSRRASFIQTLSLCKTLGGVNCQVLTITEPSKASKQVVVQTSKTANQVQQSSKKGVVISARVHPGETVGSWMMRGVLFFLTDPDSKEAKLLRKSFIFKIIPMLNPDGVINGNYRCSLAGCDLNRRWKFPSRQLQPTIYHTKRLIKKVHMERTLVMYCDLHGHSRKPNIFMYGCDIKGSPEETRVFPLLLSKISPLFDFSSSRFGVQKSKEATARVAVFKELKNCPLVYTIESTFSGLDIGEFAGLHVNTDMLESMGKDLCRGLLVQCNLQVPLELAEMPTIKQRPGKTSKTFSAEPDNNGGEKVLSQHASLIRQTLLAELQNNKELLRAGQGDSSSGSDSEPSEDNLEATELVKNLPAVDKPLSLALKQEQAVKKEQAKQKRLERGSSPQKGGDPSQRWRWSNAQQATKTGDDQSPTKKARTGGTIKLSEIKEVNGDDQSNASPLKVGRDAVSKNTGKPKVKMVDAVTQTERSDLFLMKTKGFGLKPGMRSGSVLENKLQQRQGPVQLRISNIELHESAFVIGSHNKPNMTTTTTVNIQQTTSSRPETHQTGAAESIIHPSQQTSINDLKKYKTNFKNSAIAAQIHQDQMNVTIHRKQVVSGQKHLVPSSKQHNQSAGKQSSSKQSGANAAAAGHQFQRYIKKQKDKNAPMMTSHAVETSQTNNSQLNMIEGVDSSQIGQKSLTQQVSYRIPTQKESSSIPPTTTPPIASTNGSGSSNVQARYSSVQQPRLKQLQEFQAQSRAAQGQFQHQQLTMQELGGGGGVVQGGRTTVLNRQLRGALTEIKTNGDKNSTQPITSNPYSSVDASEEAIPIDHRDVINRIGNNGQSRIIVSNGDYSANTFKKQQRFQLGSGNSSRKKSAQKQSPAIPVDQQEQLTVHQIGEMLVVESQQSKTNQMQRNTNNLAQFAPLSLSVNTNEGPKAGGSRWFNNNQNASEKKGAQSPLVAFLETQIEFEKANLYRHNVPSQMQLESQLLQPRGSSGVIDHNQAKAVHNFSKTSSFNINQALAGTATDDLQKKDLNMLKPYMQGSQLSQMSKDSLPKLRTESQMQDDAQLQQHHLHDMSLNRVRSQTTHHTPNMVAGGSIPADTSVVKAFEQYVNASVEKQGSIQIGARNVTAIPVDLQQKTALATKAMPAGVRNKVQQNSKSTLYNQVYEQQQQHQQLSNSPARKAGGSAMAAGSNGSGVKYVDHSHQNLHAKFFKTGNSVQGNGAVAKEGGGLSSNNLGNLHEIRERQNVSELQIYQNRTTMNVHAQQQPDGLPHLQKFGSQNEIKTAEMVPANRSNLRDQVMGYTSAQNPSSVGSKIPQITTSTAGDVGKSNNDWVTQISRVQARKVTSTDNSIDEYVLPFNKDRKRSQNVFSQQSQHHPLSGGGPHEAHNNPDVRHSALSHIHFQGTKSNTNATKKRKKFVDSNKIAYSTETPQPGTSKKVDNDYMQIMRQHNQAFVPTVGHHGGVSRKKQSGHSQFNQTTMLNDNGVHGHGRALNINQPLQQGSSPGPRAFTGTKRGAFETPNPTAPVIPASESRQSDAAFVKATSGASPLELGVLQSRKLVNSNLSSQPPFKKSTMATTIVQQSSNIEPSRMAKRKSSQQDKNIYMQKSGGGNAALPAMLGQTNSFAGSTKMKKRKSSQGTSNIVKK